MFKPTKYDIFKVLHLKGMSHRLAENIRLGRKYVKLTNTAAYHSTKHPKLHNSQENI
jgi:hypothetical protein